MSETEPLISKPPGEKEQGPEEILAVLETALHDGSPVDLIILTLEGIPTETPNLLVQEIEEGYLTMTYLNEQGEVGEGIPLDIFRVVKAELRKPESR